MSYDELVKGLREKAERFDYDGWIDTAIWFEKAADVIEELEKDVARAKEWASFWEKEANEALKKFQVAVASKPRWIPVTERLPNTGNKVIVAIRDESGDTKYDYTYSGWYSGYEDRWIVDDEYCSWVTHWMPLPTPPKEET